MYRILFAALILSLFIVGSIKIKEIIAFMDEICGWFKLNFELGIFITIIVYIFCSVTFLAGLILTLSIGFIFYQVLGSMVKAVFLGGCIIFIGA